MNREIRDKWVKALRSGDYQQGHSTLRRAHEGQQEFCCLGVLCDVFDPSSWVSEPGDYYTWHGGTAVIPPPYYEDLGLSGRQETLYNMNDTEGLSFAEIADWIEANLPAEDPQ